MDLPDGSESKESACNIEDPGSIPGLGISFGEENGNPLQYFHLENSMDRRAWWATVHGGCKRVDHDLAIKQQQWTLDSFCLLKTPHWDLNCSLIWRELILSPSSMFTFKDMVGLFTYSYFYVNNCSSLYAVFGVLRFSW